MLPNFNKSIKSRLDLAHDLILRTYTILKSIMKNKTNKPKVPKNYLPSLADISEDKTHIDPNGNMQEEPTAKDILDEKIEPPPPHAPSL
jgi:hypothetical protein